MKRGAYTSAPSQYQKNSKQANLPFKLEYLRIGDKILSANNDRISVTVPKGQLDAIN